MDFLKIELLISLKADPMDRSLGALMDFLIDVLVSVPGFALLIVLFLKPMFLYFL